MIKKKLVIYGIGKFADYVHYVFDQDSEYEVCGFCVESAFNTEKSHRPNGRALIDFEELENHFSPSDYHLFIAVGNNLIRERIFKMAKSKKFTLASYISTKASVWENLRYGENVFVDEGTMLQPFVKIGNNSIFFACNIGHHTSIGSHCLMSVTTTGGNVFIGDYSFVGMNTVIKQDVVVKEKNIIGMGCVIDKDTETGDVYNSKGTIKRSSSFEQVANRFLK